MEGITTVAQAPRGETAVEVEDKTRQEVKIEMLASAFSQFFVFGLACA